MEEVWTAERALFAEETPLQRERESDLWFLEDERRRRS